MTWWLIISIVLTIGIVLAIGWVVSGAMDWISEEWHRWWDQDPHDL